MAEATTRIFGPASETSRSTRLFVAKIMDVTDDDVRWFLGKEEAIGEDAMFSFNCEPSTENGGTVIVLSDNDGDVDLQELADVVGEFIRERRPDLVVTVEWADINEYHTRTPWYGGGVMVIDAASARSMTTHDAAAAMKKRLDPVADQKLMAVQEAVVRAVAVLAEAVPDAVVDADGKAVTDLMVATELLRIFTSTKPNVSSMDMTRARELVAHCDERVKARTR